MLPDPSVPHRVAEDTEVEIWVRVAPGTKLTRQKVRLPAGWWVASPEVVDAK